MADSTSLKNSVKSIVSDITDNTSHSEGKLTEATENQTAKIPSMFWLNLAIGGLAVAVGSEITGKRKDLGAIAGLLGPCFLMIGIYNKLVKLESK